MSPQGSWQALQVPGRTPMSPQGPWQSLPVLCAYTCLPFLECEASLSARPSETAASLPERHCNLRTGIGGHLSFPPTSHHLWIIWQQFRYRILRCRLLLYCLYCNLSTRSFGRADSVSFADLASQGNTWGGVMRCGDARREGKGCGGLSRD